MENEVVDMEKDPFKEYLRESEPDKAHKSIYASHLMFRVLRIPVFMEK